MPRLKKRHMNHFMIISFLLYFTTRQTSNSLLFLLVYTYTYLHTYTCICAKLALYCIYRNLDRWCGFVANVLRWVFSTYLFTYLVYQRTCMYHIFMNCCFVCGFLIFFISRPFISMSLPSTCTCKLGNLYVCMRT